eukprot:6406428-Karenia_brevis.AAC.1
MLSRPIPAFRIRTKSADRRALVWGPSRHPRGRRPHPSRQRWILHFVMQFPRFPTTGSGDQAPRHGGLEDACRGIAP